MLDGRRLGPDADRALEWLEKAGSQLQQQLLDSSSSTPPESAEHAELWYARALACARVDRGLGARAVAPDGTRLYAFLQRPLADPPPAADAPAEPSIGVPLVVVDPVSGRTLAEHLYPLGDPDSDACRWCIAAADGKVSAIAAAGPRALLVLEQSDTESRLYRVEIPERSAPGRTPLGKTLVADLAPLAAAFQADVVPGSTAAPARLSELKFEGMTLLGPDRVALVNDNDFDIAADGGGPAVPAARRSCLWILRLPAPLP